MNPIGEIENLYPEIKQVEQILDNSMDLRERFDAITSLIRLQKRLVEEIHNNKTLYGKDEGISVAEKILATSLISGILIHKAGTVSAEKIQKRYEQTVRRLKGIDDGKTEREIREKQRTEVEVKPVLLLSYYLEPSFIMFFERAGFKVLHINHFPLSPSAQEHVLRHISDPESARKERVNWHDKAVSQYISWIMNGAIDVVIEWQHGREDYPLIEMYQEVRGHVRNLLGNRYEDEVKTMPNFSNPPDFYLCLNWDGNVPDGWQEKGYKSLLEVDFDEDDLEVIYQNAMKRKLNP